MHFLIHGGQSLQCVTAFSKAPSCPAWPPFLSQAGDRQEAELQKSFKDWWDDKYFHTRPFYPQYRELHGIGADSDFVEHLAGLLKYYDFVRALGAKSGRSKSKADSKLFRDRILLRFAALHGMRHGTVDHQKAEEIAEAILEETNFRRTVTINAQGSDGKLRRKGLIKEFAQAVAPEFEEKWHPILIEYLFAAMSSSGKPADDWGNLILVALAEHLKEKTSRPHYSLALRTLKALRGKHLGSKRADTANGKSRVIQFKRRHKNWRDLVKDLEREINPPN